MGYGIIGYKTLKDKKMGDAHFYTSCMYAYDWVFKEIFGCDILDFDYRRNGKITENDIETWEEGLYKLKDNPGKYTLNDFKLLGYIDNKNFNDLINDLLELVCMMKNKKVRYLNIT